jgi:glycine/D-amino acid oxidase-like deaminating enzyme
MGLRAAALASGVRLFEGSPLTGLAPGPTLLARAGDGVVSANTAVLATNAYTRAIGFKPRLVAPLRVSLFESAPLTDDQRAELGWGGREGVYTAHEVLESYRLTAQNTIVGGSKVVRYAYGSGLPAAYDPDAFRTIEGAFRARFPSLRQAPVATFWGGWIGLTLDFLPAFGRTGQHDNVLYGVGFAGHGVAQATLMGDMLAERVLGREHAWEKALARRTLSWPPEPIRWIAAKLVNGALEAVDRRTDRQIGA